MPRSDRQKAASRTNGQKSKGPTSTAGKSRSSRNAQAHGLTGKLEASPDEAVYLQGLWQRLADQFNPEDAGQSKLIQIALMSELRMLRAYSLIRSEVQAMLGTQASEMTKERNAANQAVSEIRAAIIAETGVGHLPISIARMVAEAQGVQIQPHRQRKTNVSTLISYAQRFRGQRDRALKKLQMASLIGTLPAK